MSCDASAVVHRVEGAGLPDLMFRFSSDLELSSTFSSIKGVVRLNSGIKLVKDAVIDSDAEGVFHFEFDDDDIHAGMHHFEIEFVSLASGKILIVPDGAPILLDTRERV
jgi:hypothetical protein